MIFHFQIGFGSARWFSCFYLLNSITPFKTNKKTR